MDMEFEKRNLHLQADAGGQATRPDWYGLRSRLAAAHAARAACAHLAQYSGASSFDALSAGKVGAFSGDSGTVNPVALGYVKPVESIREPVAATVLAGDRG